MTVAFDNTMVANRAIQLSVIEAIAALASCGNLSQTTQNAYRLNIDGTSHSFGSAGGITLCTCPGGFVLTGTFPNGTGVSFGAGLYSAALDPFGIMLNSNLEFRFRGTAVKKEALNTDNPTPLRVVYWEERNSKLATVTRMIAVYRGLNLIGCHGIENDTSASQVYLQATTAATVSDLGITEIPFPAVFATIDPGETVAAGIGRLLQDQRLNVMALSDGTLQVEKPHYNVDINITPYHNLRYNKVKILRYAVIPSLAREVSAYPESEVLGDPDHSIRGVLGSNANVLSAAGATAAAQMLVVYATEEGTGAELAIPYHPLLQLGDTILYNSELWRITGLAVSFTPPIISEKLNLVKVTYAE